MLLHWRSLRRRKSVKRQLGVKSHIASQQAPAVRESLPAADADLQGVPDRKNARGGCAKTRRRATGNPQRELMSSRYSAVSTTKVRLPSAMSLPLLRYGRTHDIGGPYEQEMEAPSPSWYFDFGARNAGHCNLTHCRIR